jgi:two-component system chemotaxis response regulator CheB
VVGASAGGVEALRDFVATLPADLSAAVLVVLHVPPNGHSALPSILARAGALPARGAVDGEEIEAGTILVAPPDHHLLVLDGHVGLSHGPQENGHRPAVDVLFRSAARARGAAVAAVVLSGSLDDGAAGAVAVAQSGGVVLVQDFDEALYDGMPRAAALAVSEAQQAPVGKLSSVLVDWLATVSLEPVDRPSPLIEIETAMAELDAHTTHQAARPGDPSGFGCPDCAGSLFRIQEGGLTRFRCRVGHAWSPESLLARQSIAMESALWMALRALEEKATLNTELSTHADERGQHTSADRFRGKAAEAVRAAEMVRRLIDQVGNEVG